MSRAQLTSTVEQNSAGAASPYVGAKNFVANGGMDIWQRGTSFTSPFPAYTADRFAATASAGGTTWTVSQAASFLTGSRYAYRVQRTSGQTGTPAFYIGMAFETSEIIRLAGQTVTWSFYAKAGADYSASGTQIAVQFNTGTGTDQGPFVQHTGEVIQINTTATLSKTVANRYTYTFTIPSNTTSARLNIVMQPIGTASANDYFDFTNMQLEVGSVATPFSRAAGTLQGELALAQRYYQRIAGGAAYSFISSGIPASSTTIADFLLPLPVQMRTTPSSTIEVSNLACSDNTTNYSSGTFTFVSVTSGPSVVGLRYTHGSAALTQYRPYYLCNNSSASGYLGLSAEL